MTSSTGLTDTALYTYGPYGNVTSQSGSLDTTNPWEYASSYYQTVTGLAKLGDRYYNQAVQRFTQSDSIAGSIPPSGTVNPYVYANDDPISMTDPSGRNSTLIYSGLIITGVGLVACAAGWGLVAGVFGLGTDLITGTAGGVTTFGIMAQWAGGIAAGIGGILTTLGGIF